MNNSNHISVQLSHLVFSICLNLEHFLQFTQPLNNYKDSIVHSLHLFCSIYSEWLRFLKFTWSMNSSNKYSCVQLLHLRRGICSELIDFVDDFAHEQAQ